MKGRRSKDPALAQLQGNTRHQRKPPVSEASPTHGEPQPAPKEAEVFFSEWDAPAHLSELARRIWQELLPTVRRETKLQRSQLGIFALYCAALADWRIYDETIRREGAVYQTKTGYRRKAPEVELRAAAARDVTRLAAELNLTTKSWISSMGTFKGQQLDLFMNGDAPAPKAPEASAPASIPAAASEDDIDAFLGRRPTMQ